MLEELTELVRRAYPSAKFSVEPVPGSTESVALIERGRVLDRFHGVRLSDGSLSYRKEHVSFRDR